MADESYPGDDADDWDRLPPEAWLEIEANLDADPDAGQACPDKPPY